MVGETQPAHGVVEGQQLEAAHAEHGPHAVGLQHAGEGFAAGHLVGLRHRSFLGTEEGARGLGDAVRRDPHLLLERW